MNPVTSERLTSLTVPPVPDLAVSSATVVLRCDESVPPAAFLGGIEALRRADIDVTIKWEYAGEHVQATYEDAGVRVILTGPRLTEDKPERPDAEIQLRRLAADLRKLAR